MVDYVLAIPSYKREKTIQKKTLKLLDEHNISPEKVVIFVANDEEKENYSKELQNHKYGKNIVVGVPTIGAQRNFIENYYPEGTKLMMFDDDLNGVYIKKDKSLVPIDNLEKDFIEKGFMLCAEKNAKCFGLYAAANHFFMKHRIYESLCYIPGGTFGVIVEHNEFLKRRLNHGEDYEYSIRQYVHNGILVRFDDITIKSAFFKEPGGLQTIRTKQYIYDSIKEIQDTFPELCKMYIRKSTGNAELRLRDNAEQKGRLMYKIRTKKS